MFNKLQENISHTIKKPIAGDNSFLEYLVLGNGGYYFNNSLHIFGLSQDTRWHDVNHINELVSSEYGQIVDGCFFFAEDVFGNLFGLKNEEIIFFNIESGDSDIIADSLDNWEENILQDIDYYTGCEFVPSSKEAHKLISGYRMCPKYPFLLGGEYESSNLYIKRYDKNIAYQAHIAKQVYGKPDGTKVVLNIT